MEEVMLAAHYKALLVLDCLSTEIVGSNPALGINVCPFFSLLHCPV